MVKFSTNIIIYRPFKLNKTYIITSLLAIKISVFLNNLQKSSKQK